MPSSVYARAPRYGRGAQRPLKPWARDSALRALIGAYSIRCRCLLGDGRLPETGDTAPLYRDEQPVYKICITLLLFHDISADEEKRNATNGEGTAARAGVLVGGNRGGYDGAYAGGEPIGGRRGGRARAGGPFAYGAVRAHAGAFGCVAAREARLAEAPSCAHR